MGFVLKSASQYAQVKAMSISEVRFLFSLFIGFYIHNSELRVRCAKWKEEVKNAENSQK